MALSVKSYLNFESGNPEIRRFSIPQDVSASYDYLVEKIRQVYPSLLRKVFTLFWRDEENELVTLSSDEELVIALGCNSQANFKVYIKESFDSTDGTSGSQKEQHPGVVCDVCDKGIFGTRFKCLSCPDYDLCSGCECKGFHSEHEMLRIRTPKENPWEGFWHTIFGPRGHHRGRRCHMRGRHGPRPHCPPPFPPNFPGPHPRGGFPGPYPHGGMGFGCAFGNGWQNQPGHCGSKPSAEDKQQGEKQQEGEKQGQFQSSTSEQQLPTFQEIFTQASELARQFMNPDQSWGFDQNQSCCEQKDAPVKNEEGEKSTEMKGDNEDIPMPNESFVVVNECKEEVKETPPSQSQQSGGTRRREEEEFERRLDEAIRQMEGMGFNNDNGWLTQLLIAKDFDIGRVIDTLQLKQD